MSALLTLPIPAPGEYGLNTEDDITSLSPKWASTTHNCVIDENGRLGARRGYSFSTTEYGSSIPPSGIRDTGLTDGSQLIWQYQTSAWTFTNPGYSSGVSSGYIRQLINISAGEYYTTSVTITGSGGGGSISIWLGGIMIASGVSGVGTYTIDALAGDTDTYVSVVFNGAGYVDISAINVVAKGPANIVDNPLFLTDTVWTKGTGWTINTITKYGEKAAGAATALSQSLALIPGKEYILVFDLYTSAGNITPYIGGTAGTTRNGWSTYTETITAGSTDSLIRFEASATFAGYVTNVVVYTTDTDTKFEQVFEYLDEDGVSEIIFTTTSGAILQKSGATNVNITPSTPPTSGNFQFQNFNNYLVGWCAGETPIYWTGTGSANQITFTYPSSGTNTWGNAVLAAFGRLWTTDSTKTVIKYSDLLIYNSFTNDAGGAGDPAGSAGVIDLKKVWPNGMDYVEAIAEFNGRLIIFGKRSILVYAYPWDPLYSMQLEDTIEGMGCIARDSVQHIGEDIVFLSDSGVRSLARTIQEKSAPIGDLTRNIRKTFLTQVSGETKTKIRSVFNRTTGEYILTIPTSKVDYVLNFKRRLQDGLPRITTWNLNPSGMCFSITGNLYFVVNHASQGLVTYTGWQDNGNSYSYSYISPWWSLSVFDPQYNNRDIIPKSIKGYFFGGREASVRIQWAFDFGSNLHSREIVLDTVEVAEYGIAEYGIGEYSSGSVYSIKRPTMSGHGKLMQLRVSATINGYQFGLQRLDPFIKVGSLLK